MLIKEHNATSKWCPFAGLTALVYMSSGRALDEDDMENFTCTASQCMAWRWYDIDDVEEDPASRRGYCGLAGRTM